MNDVVELIGKGSIIQHGKLNDRIYLLKLDERDVGDILHKLTTLADKNNYSKLFCKVPKKLAPVFLSDAYVLEAYIPKFYNNQEDVFFVSKFLNPDRLLNVETNQLSGLSKLLSEKPGNKKILKSDFSIRRLNDSDIEQITAIYSEVFESYPFPIHDPEYIRETMNDNVLYFGAEKDGVIVALASSEMDLKGRNAEMTDFATLPAHAGNSLALMLLDAMDGEMKNRGIKTLYTIARLNSIPMNLTFLRSDYQYSGTLIKNTNIAGKIESMNVLYKHI
ncbi:MAG: putative beta-lysine N-acetyltransferase [Bacteroides sp.]|nr:putative beta-lysine N-acetyltransferase [Bacteroides sp.]